MKILIIEDSAEIVESISIALELRWSGATLLSTSYGKKGIELVRTESPDVVILDIGLPDIGGFDVLREIRGFSDVPVVVLTVKSDEIDTVRGLELGADDYLSKPFSHLELLARIKTALRHHDTQQAPGEQVIVGNLIMDFASREVRIGDERIKLTSTEYRLLNLLVKDAGRVVSHSRLMRELWGEDLAGDSEALRTYVYQLRKKLNDSPPRLILSEHGVGYKFVPSA